MTTLPAALVLLTAAAVCTLIGISYLDWAQRRIPNRSLLLLLALFAAYAYTKSISLQQIGFAAGLAAAVATLFLLFHLLGGMAAGDVKLAFVVFLWVPPQQLMAALLLLAALSILLGVSYAVIARRGGSAQVPYGVALALTGVGTLAWSTLVP